MEKKTILAILLTLGVWIGWFYLFNPAEEHKNAKNVQTVENKSEKKEVKEEKPGPGNVKISRPSRNVKQSEVTIKTDKYEFRLTNKGAAVEQVKYLERNIDLVVDINNKKNNGQFNFSVHFNENDFLNGSVLDDSVWDFVKTGDYSVKFFTEIKIEGVPVIVEKNYIFTKDTYGFKVDYRIKNAGNKEIRFNDRGILYSPSDMIGPALDFKNSNNHVSSIYSIAGDFTNELKGGGFFSTRETVKKTDGQIDWVGLMGRYFLVIMIPENGSGTSVISDNRDGTGFRTGISSGVKSLEAGKESRKSFKVYLGEKDKDKLLSIDKSIVSAFDVNKLIEPIRWFVIWCLKAIDGFVGNLGWALVIFSFLSKLVFMPLTNKSNKSMKKMQMLTPEINKLKEKFKDKPDVMQKEMMKLYKDNKVNPLGGCFPLLLQMPFFFALYSALINSIDLWNAHFIFWMKDLSMPDTVATISGVDINILPIIMTISTFVMQKLTSVDTGPQQKIMMYMMPVMFIFIFWTMPSGLVLYWTLQNVFQIAHQLIVTRMGKTPKAAN